jgi:predicted phosphohydrolase
MAVYALGDLHLAFSVPDKSMEVFGPAWDHYAEKIEMHWKESISPSDLVLLPGDISWAMKPEQALIDLNWIDALPGTKVMIRGNHDYWWTSPSKLRSMLPPSIHMIQNDTFQWNHLTIGGARLWDTPEYSFGEYIVYKENPRAKEKTVTDTSEEDAKIFARELQRLEMSLKLFDKNASLKIAMTHYPPIGADLQPSLAAKILKTYGTDICVFGHLHNVKQNALPFGKVEGIEYALTSADYLEFRPLKLLE